MSVYIKGMEMPTHCIDCPFMVSRDDDDCILQSDEANENFENWEQMKAGCPLVPVPEHGRLIEAGRLKEVFHRNVVSGDAFDQLIDIAPTIIPASGGNENE